MAAIAFAETNDMKNSLLANETQWNELRSKSSQIFMRRDFDGAKEAETQPENN